MGHPRAKQTLERQNTEVRRRRGRLRNVIGAVLIVLLGLALAGPLLVRGPAMRWLFARAFASRCGHFSISGAHLGWASVFQVALGRPLRVTVDGLAIAGPDLVPVLDAARLEATAEVKLFPLRILVVDAVVADGQWRLAEQSDGGGSSMAFRPIPPRGRAACLVPPTGIHSSPADHGAVSAGPAVVVQHARLQDLDVDLDFPDWRVALSHVDANLSLTLARVLRFDFRGVKASSGSVRVGPDGAPWTAAVAFDRVVIDRVAVVPDAATDLLLAVGSARTGRASLSGRAVFRNIFPGTASTSAAAGLDVDATWVRFGGALALLQASWRPQGDWSDHLDGDLHVGIRGPFTDLVATLHADGRGTRVEASLTHGLATLRLQCAAAETAWLVGPALRGLLGGSLHGVLVARLRLAPTVAAMDGEISEANLRLDRRAVDSEAPERVVVRVGDRAMEAPSKPSMAGSAARTIGRRALTDRRFSVDIRHVRLTGGQLQITGAQLRWTGLSVRADATLAFAEGRLDLRLPPPSTFVLGGQRLELPRLVALRWSEQAGLVLAPVRLRARGGALVQVGGRLSPDDRIDAQILIRNYGLRWLPSGGQGGLVGEVKGLVAARLDLSGSTALPLLRGKAEVKALAVHGQRLGDARATIRLGGRGGVVDARVGRTLAVTATIRRQPRLAVVAAISMRKQGLSPWLRGPLAAAPIEASGTIQVSYLVGHPVATRAAVDLAGPGLDNVKVVAHASGRTAVLSLAGQIDVARWPSLWSPYLAHAEGAVSVELDVRYPVHDPFLGLPVVGSVRIVRALELRLPRRLGVVQLPAGDQVILDGDSIASSGLRVDTSWFQGRLSGRMGLATSDVANAPLSLSLAGTVDVGRLPLRLPARTSARGKAALTADLTGSVLAPTVRGHLRLTDVVVRLPSVPSMVLDGSIEADGHDLTTRDLVLDVAGGGQIAVGSPAAPARVAWQSLRPFRLGAVDVPFFGRNLAIGMPEAPVRIRDLDVTGRLTGTSGALELVGDAVIAGGVLDSSRTAKQARGRRRPWYADLPPGLTVRLRLRGPNKAMRIAVPLLPDVTVEFDCRLTATRDAVSLTGSLRGDGTYDRAAVDLYAWLAAKDLRRCQIAD